MGHKYLQRFIDKYGAKPSNGNYPLFWQIAKYWAPATLYRHRDLASNDSSFQACLLREGGAESKHQNKINGIIAGSVIGGVLVLGGIALGIVCCCCRRAGQGRDVELGAGEPPSLRGPAPAPVVTERAAPASDDRDSFVDLGRP